MKGVRQSVKRKRIIRPCARLLLAAALLAATGCGTQEGAAEDVDAGLAQSGAAEAARTACAQQGASATAVPGSLRACAMAVEGGEALRYWLYTPENPAENMPLIVYLHGASGRGGELEQVVADEDFPRYLQTGELSGLRAYVLIPQLPAGQRSWSAVADSVYALIRETVSGLPIDEGNVSLSGFSMGGTAVWEFAAQSPGLFARIAPISGSARAVLDRAPSLLETPVWALVGSADTVIRPHSSEQMVAELERAGGAARLTVFDGAEHVSVPGLVWRDDDLHLADWLIGAAG